MNCPSCSASAPDAAEFCPSCLGTLRGPPQRLGSPPAAAPPVATSVAASEAQVDPTNAPAVPRCPNHPDFPAAGTCQRCGTFLCIRCDPEAARGAKLTCPACEATRFAAGTPQKLAKLHRQLWLGPMLAGVVAIAFFVVMPWLVSGSLRGHVPFALGGAVTGLPLLACGIFYAKLRSTRIAWTAVVFELLLAAGLFIVSRGINFVVLAIFALAIISVFRILHLQELERLLQESRATPGNVGTGLAS